MASPLGLRKSSIVKAVSTAPSSNKTPVGSSTPPLPYPVTQDLFNSIGVVPHVKINGDPIYVLDQSVQPSCIGDSAGSVGGIKSGTVSGEVKPTSSSGHVKITGKKAVRVGDTCTMNNGNCPGVYVGEPTTAAPGAPPNPKVTAETPEEKGFLEKAGDLLEKLEIEKLRKFKNGINTGLDGVVEASGYNPVVMVVAAIAVAANEVFVPESLIDFTPGKAIGMVKKGAKATGLTKKISKTKKLKPKGDGFHVKKKKFYRSKSERRKALKRDAEDPNSGLTQEQRDFIKENDGNKVPSDCEVSHDVPLYSEKTIDGKRALDTADNMTTMKKVEHRALHRTCGGTFHDFPR